MIDRAVALTLDAVIERERRDYPAARPRCAALAAAAVEHCPADVPIHWVRD